MAQPQKLLLARNLAKGKILYLFGCAMKTGKLRLGELTVTTKQLDVSMNGATKTEAFEAYVAALRVHNSKVAIGQRTNRAALWRKQDKAIAEWVANIGMRIIDQKELDKFSAAAKAAVTGMRR